MATGNDAGDVGRDIPEYSREEMGVQPIRDEIKEMLAPMELEMYREWRMDFARWSFDRGKDEYFYEGYSKSSMPNIISRVETFVLWVFETYGFTTTFREDHVDQYWHRLRSGDNQLSSNRRTINNVSLVLKHRGIEWDIPKSKRVYEKLNKSSASGFTDWFETRELERIKHASLRAFSVPNREDMEPGEREEWAEHLSQRLRKPVADLDEEDWDRANSYKVPSMVYVSRDIGLRPTEVESSPTSWFILDGDERTDDPFVKIPKDEDSKDGKDNWRCYLSDETARLVRLWLDERSGIPMYDDRDEMWLTREANPYCADSLRRPIMQTLMDEAGIDRSNREQGWYMIRRGVGTEIANEKGLSAVMSQLRINRMETAKRYVQTDAPSIRDWLNNR